MQKKVSSTVCVCARVSGGASVSVGRCPCVPLWGSVCVCTPQYLRGCLVSVWRDRSVRVRPCVGVPVCAHLRVCVCACVYLEMTV